jgi:hypothetical protein
MNKKLGKWYAVNHLWTEGEKRGQPEGYVMPLTDTDDENVFAYLFISIGFKKPYAQASRSVYSWWFNESSTPKLVNKFQPPIKVPVLLMRKSIRLVFGSKRK